MQIELGVVHEMAHFRLVPLPPTPLLPIRRIVVVVGMAAGVEEVAAENGSVAVAGVHFTTTGIDSGLRFAPALKRVASEIGMIANETIGIPSPTYDRGTREMTAIIPETARHD
jgi:hypothetical protein